MSERKPGDSAASIAPPPQRVRWSKAFRIINTRYPPVDLFDRIAEPSDWEALYEIEALTNPRLRHMRQQIVRIPKEEWVYGEGASWVMAPFIHVGPSRFSRGEYGVYYAAQSQLTAIHETAYHYACFLLATAEARGTELQMRVLVSERLEGRFHDLRGGHPELHHPADYGAAQRFGEGLRRQGASGIVYDSVRHPGGHCIAILRPKAIPLPVQGPHLRYHFDGQRVDRFIQIGQENWKMLTPSADAYSTS